MKYARVYCRTLLLALIMALGACATQGKYEFEQYDGSEPAELVPTEQFLPRQERDESGERVPYEPMPNPYAELTGQIDREAITSYIEARRAFNLRNYAVADQLLAELAADNPELSGPLVMRGDIAMSRQNPAQAMEYYLAALEVNPVNFNAYLRLAKAQRMRGDFLHAQNTYARALERWPDGAEIHLNLGILYDLYLNKPVQAQAHMEAYQLISGDNSGNVVKWLEEIRERTGVTTALTAVSSQDDSSQDSSSQETSEPQISRTGTAEE